MNGFGDAAVMLNYKIFARAKNTFSQQLWIGGSIKLPSGKFVIDASDPDVAAVANTQLGSGSTDFLLNGMYNVRMNQFGMNVSANYKINTTNKQEYRFGNKLTTSVFAYYDLHATGIIISPNLGVSY